MEVDFSKLSPTQQKVLRCLARHPNMSGNLGGHGRAPLLSAARALARKGIIRAWRTSSYAIPTEHQTAAKELLQEWVRTRVSS